MTSGETGVREDASHGGSLDGYFVLPCSFGQRRLWFLNELDPASGGAYIGSGAVRLRGPLDARVLSEAVELVARRHETLRTALAVLDGEPVQAVSPEPALTVDVLDVSGDDRPEAGLREAVSRAATEPFDLTRAPLARVTLVRAAPEDHALLVTFHHAVSDLWSGTIFFRELAACYAALADGRTPQLPELPVQYGDYAAWQADWADSRDALDQLVYWRGRLDDLSVLDLPTDRPRPPVQTFSGATTSVELPGGLVRALDELGRRAGATRFMVLLSAFAMLLSRYSGLHDVTVGSPHAGRGRPELENLVGFFVNNLVLRTDLSGEPDFIELLARVRESCLAAYAHPDIPFERLVEVLQPPRDLSRSPLFQVVFMLANTPLAGLEFAGREVEALEVDSGTAKFDLFLTVAPSSGDGLQAMLEYNTDLFDVATADRMLVHLRTLLQEIAADPRRPVDTLPLQSAAEAEMLADWGSGRAVDPPPACLPQLFEAQVRRTPDAVAVTLPDGPPALTYRELDERAEQFARHLRTHGVGRDGLVAVCLERSTDMLPALLGVLKAGGAYVPVDPALPAERVRFMLQDCAAPVLLTQRSLLGRLAGHPGPVVCVEDPLPALPQQGAAEPLPPVSADDLAYVLYTSGSTGRPKGVMVHHGALANFLTSMVGEPGLNGNDVLAAVTTLSFDIAALELYLPLVVGARVVVLARDDSADGTLLARRLHDCEATVMQATPATWQLLRETGWRPSRPFTALCGGEELTGDLAADLVATGATVWNLYGPTETTVWSSVHRVRGTENPVPLGRPIARTRLHVLDDRGNPAPIGVPGELTIGGDGVARGYLNRPGLTDERFLPDPADPARRVYRTGDLVRYRGDGALEYLGRTDFQVKLRGFRIELGEIEATLRSHPAVRETVVAAREDGHGGRRLVAYAVPDRDSGLDPSRELGDGEDEQAAEEAVFARELREHARERLPAYEVPAHVVLLDALPLTANGKVDRGALPAPDVTRTRETCTPPSTPAEEEMIRIFATALGTERVGVHDDFFALGGHSLLATRVLAAVAETWNVELPVRTLFQQPTAAGIARIVEAGGETPDLNDTGPDLRGEVTLDPSVAAHGSARRPAQPAQVLFTGATGFLGAFLLDRVLRETQATAHCLVRARSDEEAQERLANRLRGFGLWDEAVRTRIRAFAGELSAPRFGLADGDFGRLAEESDEIYHVGADVNFLRPYRALAAANVGGTREVLRLASAGQATPVHHVSTFSVFAMRRDGDEPCRESELPETPPSAENGYSQSKWVAEQVVALARERGLPVAVYRPGRVAGHSRTGLWNTDDVTARVFRACAETGLVPDVDIHADMLPVEYVAAAIARLARHPEAPGRNFHFRGPRTVALPRIAEVLGTLGYAVRRAPIEEWLAACHGHAARVPGSDLGPIASLFGFRVEQHQRGLRDPLVDDSTTRRLLGDDIRCPEVDDDILRGYLRSMAASGFLPQPGATAQREVLSNG